MRYTKDMTDQVFMDEFLSWSVEQQIRYVTLLAATETFKTVPDLLAVLPRCQSVVVDAVLGLVLGFPHQLHDLVMGVLTDIQYPADIRLLLFFAFIDQPSLAMVTGLVQLYMNPSDALLEPHIASYCRDAYVLAVIPCVEQLVVRHHEARATQLLYEIGQDNVKRVVDQFPLKPDERQQLSVIFPTLWAS